MQIRARHLVFINGFSLFDGLQDFILLNSVHISGLERIAIEDNKTGLHPDFQFGHALAQRLAVSQHPPGVTPSKPQPMACPGYLSLLMLFTS